MGDEERREGQESSRKEVTARIRFRFGNGRFWGIRKKPVGSVFFGTQFLKPETRSSYRFSLKSQFEPDPILI